MNQKAFQKRNPLKALHWRNLGTKGLKMKPGLGRIEKVMMVWEEILFKKKKKEKRGEKKENLLTIQHVFGYGFTHGLSMFCFLFCFVFSFFLLNNHTTHKPCLRVYIVNHMDR